MQELKMNPTMWAGWIYCHIEYTAQEKDRYEEAMKVMVKAMAKETRRRPTAVAERIKGDPSITYYCPECEGFLSASACGRNYMSGTTRCPGCGQLIDWEQPQSQPDV